MLLSNCLEKWQLFNRSNFFINQLFHVQVSSKLCYVYCRSCDLCQSVNVFNVIFLLLLQTENSLTLLGESICRCLILSGKDWRGKKKKAPPSSYRNAFIFLCGQETWYECYHSDIKKEK